MTDHPCRFPRVLLEGAPTAQALIQGDSAYPDLQGEVLFYPYQTGSLLLVRLAGLPRDGFFAMHIHDLGNCCTGGDLPFHCTGGHYNPTQSSHPDHAGDLPVVLSSGGCVYALYYTGRFRPSQVVDRSVVLHSGPDDYRSQPAGDSGGRIACGRILPV